ncbi:GntP family permease [Streptomyces endophyticus]|uniref:GntP family permease n=1 Tax=Streptomyces endophyticus TaxID=714166 RepID=A0ABU6EW15_9ACTN|nr:gluconate permease [Streptomyces endophyticus]MEB8335936.1 GntP family permease [Streptomyces endophyticus]
MSHEALLFLSTAVAIGGIVVAITWLKLPPVLALLFGTLFLGLTTSVGAKGTPDAVADGFADVMGEIGILVSLGVMLGALLTAADTMQRLVGTTLKAFGRRSIPYVFAVTLSSLFTAIYSDVLLVLSAPLARRLAPKLGARGRALMGGALTAGIEVGLVFVAPGVAAVAIAGILDVPLGQMFLLGLVVALPTALLTVFVFSVVLRWMTWDPATDEIEDGEAVDASEEPDAPAPDSAPPVTPTPAGRAAVGTVTDAPAELPQTPTQTQTQTHTRKPRPLPLALAVTPVLLVLVLIAGGALADGLSLDVAPVGFLTDPVVALLLGTTVAYVLARRVRSREEIGDVIGKSLAQCGSILVLSGISGSLGAIIERSGMGRTLGDLFSSGILPPLLLVWIMAAVLHIALGSISVAGITAAGILAPIAGHLDTPLVLVALAAGSGALFVPHVSSNFFWMFQSLLGFSTRGTIKTHTVPMTLASLISLPIILTVAVFV